MNPIQPHQLARTWNRQSSDTRRLIILAPRPQRVRQKAFDIRAGSGITLNPGLPSFTGRIFGHPEAITFPTNYPELREPLTLAHGGGIDSWQLKGIMRLVDWGVISKARCRIANLV